jgi:hypothetical protein
LFVQRGPSHFEGSDQVVIHEKAARQREARAPLLEAQIADGSGGVRRLLRRERPALDRAPCHERVGEECQLSTPRAARGVVTVMYVLHEGPDVPQT